jgi:hypothetical protein
MPASRRRRSAPILADFPSPDSLSPPPSGNPLLLLVAKAIEELPPRAQNAMVRFLSNWAGTKAERRALLVKLLDPDLTDGMVAELAGVDRTTLYTWPSYRRLKVILAKAKGDPPSGLIDRHDLILDAWVEADE